MPTPDATIGKVSGWLPETIEKELSPPERRRDPADTINPHYTGIISA